MSATWATTASSVSCATATGQPVFDGMWGQDGRDPGEFNKPYGLCVDTQDNFYVTDSGNHRLQKFDASGRLVYAFGTLWEQGGRIRLAGRGGGGFAGGGVRLGFRQ